MNEKNKLNKGSLIPEVYNFLNTDNGVSLIVFGAAGTGKTTLALSMIEIYSDFIDAYYLSTRVNDDSLLIHFPWLKNKAKENAIAKPVFDNNKVRTMKLDIVKDKSVKNVTTSYLDKLYYKYTDEKQGVNSNNINIKRFQKISEVYDIVNKNLPDSTLIVIDSVNGLADEYDVKPEEIIYAIQKDLVEGCSTKAIFVMENEDSNANYLADGIISLSLNYHENRILRVAEIKKLRGMGVESPYYVFSLNNGKFKVPTDYSTEYIRLNKKNSNANDNRILSTGFEEIDENLFEEKGLVPNLNYMVNFHYPLNNTDKNFLLSTFIKDACKKNVNVVSFSDKVICGGGCNRFIPANESKDGNDTSIHCIIKASEDFESKILEPLMCKFNKVSVIKEAGNSDILSRKFMMSPFRNKNNRTVVLMDIDIMVDEFKLPIDKVISMMNEINMWENVTIIAFCADIEDKKKAILDDMNYVIEIEQKYGTNIMYTSKPYSMIYAMSYAYIKDSKEKTVLLEPLK
ncbi:MAG: RAD55 family ATPase [Thermoplasmata archaeon]